MGTREDWFAIRDEAGCKSFSIGFCGPNEEAVIGTQGWLATVLDMNWKELLSILFKIDKKY